MIVSGSGFGKTIAVHEYMVTPDASYSWKRPHTGWYETRTEKRKYNSEGELTEKSVITRPYGMSVGWRVELKYDPPGRLFGARVAD